MKERDSSLDLIKGVCILLIILGHCPISVVLHDLIFFFHVPIFFIISGYNYRERNFISEVVVSSKRLLLPFVFISSVILLVAFFRDCLGEKGVFYQYLIGILWGGGFTYHFVFLPLPKAITIGPLWFLWAMFWSRLFMNITLHLKSDCCRLGFICAIAIVFINIKQYFSLPFSLIPGICATGFLFSGYLLRKYDVLNQEHRKVLLPFSLIAFILCMMPAGNLDVNLSQYKGFYFLDLFAMIGVFWGFVIISRTILCNKNVMSLLVKIGRFSLVVYCVHALEYNLMYSYWPLKQMKFLPIGYSTYLEIGIRLVIALLGAFLVLKIPFLKKNIFNIRDVS